MEDTLLYAGVLPTLEIYESIERLQKPVIASVNGFAVGGGQVLQVVCDLTIAKESAVFRQVGPMMGSFDAGYGTWYLEDLVGKKKAKEMWFLNPKLTAREALELGLINKVVPDDKLRGRHAQDGAGDRRARRVRARVAQGRVHRAPRRRVGPLAHVARPAAAPLPRHRRIDELGEAFAERRKPRRVDASATERCSQQDSPSCRTYSPCTIPQGRAEHYLPGVWQTDTLYSLRAGTPRTRPARTRCATARRRLTWQRARRVGRRASPPTCTPPA